MAACLGGFLFWVSLEEGLGDAIAKIVKYGMKRMEGLMVGKRPMSWVGLALFALLGLNGIALGGGLDFIVENQTGTDLHQLYIAPYPAETWGKNIFDGKILRDGQERRIVLDDGESTYWDMMIPDIEASPIVWRKFNLKAISRITLIYDGDEVRIEYE